MSKEKIISICVRIAGALLLLMTFLHATWGWAEVVTAIKLGDAGPAIANTFRAIWIFSGMMFLLSAIWIFFLVSELRQLKRRAWWQGIFIGLGYTGCAVGCMLMTGFYGHLAAFGLIGLLLLIPLLLWAASFRNFRPQSSLHT